MVALDKSFLFVEKLSVSYTSQVDKQILDSKTEAISDTDRKLKSYYTINEVNTRLSATDRKLKRV